MTLVGFERCRVCGKEAHKCFCTDLNEDLKQKSGAVSSDSKLVSFLYELMRDHLPPGKVESLVRGSQNVPVEYSNGWLAKYAEHLSEKLR